MQSGGARPVLVVLDLCGEWGSSLDRVQLMPIRIISNLRDDQHALMPSHSCFHAPSVRRRPDFTRPEAFRRSAPNARTSKQGDREPLRLP